MSIVAENPPMNNNDRNILFYSLKDQLCSLHLSSTQIKALLSKNDASFELLKYFGNTFDFSGLNVV